MRKKIEFDKEEMAVYTRYWLEKHFKTQSNMMEEFGLSQPRIANILSGREMPNKDMLLSMGYEKETVYRRVK